MGTMGRVPSNFGEPGVQVYLVPPTFVTAILCWVWRLTSEAAKFFINPHGKLLDLRGMVWLQKESEIIKCDSGGAK